MTKLIQIHEPGQTPIPHSNTAAVGIDLGTTYSVAAIASDKGVGIVHNIHGHSLVPSVVFYHEGGIPEVGYSARARYERGEKGAIASIKRLMGRGIKDIKPLLGNLPYDVVEQPSEKMVRLRVGNHELTPVEISADILKHLKHNAETALGQDITHAVITVPAYFDDAARTATKDAAKLAGLEVLRLINEPTAAALAYGLDTGAEGIYAIYDLGGGTFDLSLLKMEKGVFQVLASAGDAALGGDDIDHAIATWMLKAIGLKEVSLSSEAIAVIMSLARKAKHELTDKLTTTINYNDKTLSLSRETLNTLALPSVNKTLDICKSAMEDASLTTNDIKGVVMVGGSTRLPIVLEKVEELFGSKPLNDVNPDEVVAVGAARQAHGLTQGSDNLLLDVTPLSLGLETMGGLVEKLIYRNTTIPVSVSQEFTTWQDGQTAIQVHAVQGEREMVSDNRSLAHFELRGIPPLPAGIARITITFTVDADGLLTVSAQENTTGIKQTVDVKPSYGLEIDDLERMLKDSMEHAREDISERLLVESRVEAERTIVEIESAIKQDADLLNDAETHQVTQQIRVLRNAMEEDDRDYIDAEKQQLAQLTQAFAERRMDRAIGNALKGAHIDSVEKENNA